jgi:hypothetical protein
LSIRAIPAPLRRTSEPGVTDDQVPLPEREREWVTPSEAQDEVIPPMTTREVPSLLSPRVAKAWGGSESSLPVEKLVEEELSCNRQHVEIDRRIHIIGTACDVALGKMRWSTHRKDQHLVGDLRICRLHLTTDDIHRLLRRHIHGLMTPSRRGGSSRYERDRGEHGGQSRGGPG